MIRKTINWPFFFPASALRERNPRDYYTWQEFFQEVTVDTVR